MPPRACLASSNKDLEKAGRESIRLLTECLLQNRYGLVVAASKIERNAYTGMGDRRKRVEFQFKLGFADGFIKSAHIRQKSGIPVMQDRVIGLQFERALEFPLGQRPVPVIVADDLAHRSVRFGQALVYFQSLRGGLAGQWQRLFWRYQVICAERDVGIGHSDISQRIAVVFFSGLTESFESLADAFGSAFVPLITAFHIEPIGFRVGGVVLGQLAALFAGQSSYQVIGDSLRDGVLNRKDVTPSLVELLRPKRPAATDVDQPRCDTDFVAHLLDVAFEDGLRPQLAPRRDRILVERSEATHGAEWAHGDFLQPA